MFANTPSLSALRVVLAAASAERQLLGEQFLGVGLDLTKAFLNASLPPGQRVLIRPPKEAGLPKGVCWEAVRALYGLRQSPALWSKYLRSLMRDLGFCVSRSEPSVYKHSSKRITVIVHVDDLFIFGLNSDVDSFVEELTRRVKSSLPNYLRNSGDSVLMLGRTIRLTARGFVVTTDDKHCRQVVEEMSQWRGKPLKQTKVPGRKVTSIEQNALSSKLDVKRHEAFRRNVGRLIYSSLDRPELMYMIKLLASDPAAPTEVSWLNLMNIAGYLVGREAAIMRFEVQFENGKPPDTIHAFADSDWAGNQTRKSTSGGLLVWGGCPVGFYSRGQSSFAMSSCEAELYSSISASAESLYTVGLLSELGVACKAVLHTDSAAALGLMQRPGLSRPMRHVEIKFLYLQDLIERGVLRAKKVGTKDNPADLLTKIPTVEMLESFLKMFCVSTMTSQQAENCKAVQSKKVTLSS
jgi:hypothetical protein